MFYRRKILLSLLQSFDNKIEKIALQKLLLLFSELQTKPAFHFVPYKFGCFSFQANADLLTMTKYGQVSENGNYWVSSDKTEFSSELKEEDLSVLRTIRKQYYGKTKEELLKLTYTKFPYYSINSTILHQVLNDTEYQNVLHSRPHQEGTVLYTIGYEGINFEEYLNKLIFSDVKLLCDVRRNPISMKYGFSKSQLKKGWEGGGIQYLHLPVFGIESEKRQELHSQSAYDSLFLQYRKVILASTIPQQEELLGLLKAHKRVALTCFEANIHQCHRTHLAQSLFHLRNFPFELKHI